MRPLRLLLLLPVLLLLRCAETRKEMTDSFDETEREILHTNRHPAPEPVDAGAPDVAADTDIQI